MAVLRWRILVWVFCEGFDLVFFGDFDDVYLDWEGGWDDELDDVDGIRYC